MSFDVRGDFRLNGVPQHLLGTLAGDLINGLGKAVTGCCEGEFEVVFFMERIFPWLSPRL